MSFASTGEIKVANREVPWDSFDSQSYVDRNYRALRDDDKEIIQVVRDFFADHFRDDPTPLLSGIDVGAGANLYPALTLLPWCREILLLDRASTQVSWLNSQVEHFSSTWTQYWEILREHPAYRRVADPRADFRSAVAVRRGDLFELPEGRWGTGTMFFVAESMTGLRHEMEAAVGKFIGALEPGAPFAAAFMENSLGYEVNGTHLPACPVTEADVHACLVDQAGDLVIHSVGISGNPLRDGYTGMLVACGHRAG